MKPSITTIRIMNVSYPLPSKVSSYSFLILPSWCAVSWKPLFHTFGLSGAFFLGYFRWKGKSGPCFSIFCRSVSPSVDFFYYIFLSFLFFFWCGPFLKSLLNLLQYCFCFMFWFFDHEAGRIFSSLTRDQTCTPCIGRQTLNHWTTREVPIYYIFLVLFLVIDLGL